RVDAHELGLLVLDELLLGFDAGVVRVQRLLELAGQRLAFVELGFVQQRLALVVEVPDAVLGGLHRLVGVVQRHVARALVGGLVGVALHQHAVAANGVLLRQPFGGGAAVSGFLGGALLGAEEGRQRRTLRAVGVEHALFARRAFGDGAVAGELAAIGR